MRDVVRHFGGIEFQGVSIAFGHVFCEVLSFNKRKGILLEPTPKYTHIHIK